MSSQASLETIAICMIIITAAAFLVSAGLIVALLLFKKMISTKIDEALAKVQPVIDKATDIATQARDTAERVSDKVDSIVTRAENTAAKVTDRVDSVSERVDTAVSPQVATVAGVVGTAVRAYQLYHDIKTAREGNGGEE